MERPQAVHRPARGSAKDATASTRVENLKSSFAATTPSSQRERTARVNSTLYNKVGRHLARSEKGDCTDVYKKTTRAFTRPPPPTLPSVPPPSGPTRRNQSCSQTSNLRKRDQRPFLSQERRDSPQSTGNAGSRLKPYWKSSPAPKGERPWEKGSEVIGQGL